MDNLTLPNHIMAVSRVDFNGEEWNYIVLSKGDIIENEQRFNIQWWSKSMRYYWSKYNQSFTHALNRFLLKVKPNTHNILTNIEEKTNFQDYKKYMWETLNHLLGIIKDGHSIEEDIENFLEELEN